MTAINSAIRGFRANQQWLDDIKGVNGEIKQEAAYLDLGRYAFVCAFNLLRARASTLPALADLEETTLSDRATDFAQATLEKIAANDGALLSQFRGQAAFTSWIAKITNNIVLSELRKTSYRSEIHLSPKNEEDQSADRVTDSVDILLGRPQRGPEEDTQRLELAQAIASCIKELPALERTVFWAKVVDGRTGQAIAEQLQKTRNAVYILVNSARKQLRACLESKGQDSL